MTFSTGVPTASQSPGVFPAQNNTNFARLKAIINQEHNFLNTQPSTIESQGIHRRCTMINQATPTTLPAGNGILYCTNDANNQSQLNWYNGTNFLITQPAPIRVVGSLTNVTAGNTLLAFADPGYNYVGTAYAMLTNTVIYRFQNLVKIGGISSNNTIVTNQIPGFVAPTLLFDGADLKIKNNDSITRNLTWTLIFNRIS